MKQQKEGLTVEELLKTRYKVIADWPGRATSFGSPMAVGAIIELSEITENGNPYDFIRQSGNKYSWKSENGMKVVGEKFFDSYPHLFRKLHWSEEREESDMPEYLKHENSGSVSKAAKIQSSGWFSYDGKHFAPIDGYIPATHEEYLSYTQNQIKDNGK